MWLSCDMKDAAYKKSLCYALYKIGGPFIKCSCKWFLHKKSYLINNLIKSLVNAHKCLETFLFRPRKSPTRVDVSLNPNTIKKPRKSNTPISMTNANLSQRLWHSNKNHSKRDWCARGISLDINSVGVWMQKQPDLDHNPLSPRKKKLSWQTIWSLQLLQAMDTAGIHIF